MQKHKIFAFSLLLTLLFCACSEYQKVLNKGSVEEQYKQAVKLYEQKEYGKALRLFEKVTPTYRGKPQMERIQFMIAQSNFNEKIYGSAAYYFDKFTKNYPKSSKKEAAAFLSAYCYKLASPRFSVDPTETKKAIEAFQGFINTYPDSEKIPEANKHYQELREKLERKYFEIAKTYYRTADYDLRNYNAAIQAFDNLLENFLGSKFKEEALLYRLKAAHDFVLKSTNRRKLERIKIAISAYDKLKRNFPETKFAKEADEMLLTLEEEKKVIEDSIAKQKEYQDSLNK